MDPARISAAVLAATDVPRRRAFWVPAASVLLLDFLTKRLALQALPRVLALPVFGDWFELRLVHNLAGPFGISLGAASRWIFAGIAAGALVVLYRVSQKGSSTSPFRMEALGLVAGGAAGNLIDRLLSARGVVDFFQLYLGSLRWPTFNVADMAISLGAVALAVSFLLEGKQRPRPEDHS